MDTTPTTPVNLPDWVRPFFTQPVDANLFYFIIYIDPIAEINITASQYRVWQVPNEISITSQFEKDNPEQFNMFRQEVFKHMLQEQHPDLVADVEAASHCYVVQAMLPDKPNLNDFRTGLGIITFFVDAGAVAVFDPAAYHWWSPQEWRKEVFEPETFNATTHVKMLMAREKNDSFWLLTHGLRKFGRPDLSIHYVNEEEMTAVQEMLKRFIVFMAQGGQIEEGQEVRMHELPSGMTCHHKNTIDDPVFNNYHVEITWPDPDAD